MFVLFVFMNGLFFPTSQINSEIPSQWQTNFEQAIELASTDHKKILMVFAGSDWCAPCIKLKKYILETAEFSAFEQANLVILYLDFPQRKKNKLSKEETAHHEALAEIFNQSGAFPKVVLLNEEGELIKNISYKGQSTPEFIEQIKSSI